MGINTKKILGIISILAVLALLFILLRTNKQDIARIRSIPMEIILLVVLLTTVEFYLNGLMLKVLLEPFNIKTKFKEWFGLATITTFGNYLTFFRGGTTTKAVYLKKYYNLSFSHFLASVGASYVVTLMVYGLLGIVFSLIMLFYSKLFNPILFILFIILSAMSFFIIAFFPEFPEANNKLLKNINSVVHGWHKLRKNYHFIMHFSFLALILYIVSTSKFFLLYRSLSYDITLLSSSFITLISNLSIFASITPAGLGVREAVIAFTSSLLGIGIKSGIYVSAIERAVTIVLIAILGPIYSYILIKKTKNSS